MDDLQMRNAMQYMLMVYLDEKLPAEGTETPQGTFFEGAANSTTGATPRRGRTGGG
jgi:hypothetical protein